jgi:small redox-active disulfide protein 2
MEIKVLGPGCAKCHKQFDEARKAVDEHGLDATLVKVEAIDEIASHGVLFTPAVMVDGQVIHSGSVLKAAKLAAKLKGA